MVFDVLTPSAAQAAYLAFGIGACFGVGIGLALFAPSVRLFGLFMIVQCVFHMWEFTFNAIFHPNKLSCTGL